MRTIIGVTGASGVSFALDFVNRLDGEKFGILTQWGKHLLTQETNLAMRDMEKLFTKVYSDNDLSAPPASGSILFDAMVVLPCSAGTLNKIAVGIADTLLTRTAMVALKERRKLILCLRETPLSTQTLRNAAQLSADGAIIMPIMPPYYLRLTSVEAIVEGFSTRLLQVLGQYKEDLWKGAGGETHPRLED